MRVTPLIRLCAAAIVASSLVPPSAFAQAQTPTYDRVSFSVQASEDVDTDVLVAVLYYEREGANQADVADKVNREISSGVEQAKGTAGITVQTLQYRTNPVYRSQSLTGWRARQSIRLEARDAVVLGDLLANLQSRLLVESVSYTLSREARERVEEGLIARALQAFQARAQLVTRELGRSDYRIVRVDVVTNAMPPPRVAMRAAAATLERSVAPPTLEGGAQNVQVNVQGEIEVLR